jgi:FixJ family two-component response regulator
MEWGAVPNHSQSVLVVDDDPASRQRLCREVQAAGHAVRFAPDGHAALAKLAAEPAAIVVSDIVLPGGLDGVELCRRVREAHPETEIILVTGFASIATAIEGVRLGASDYLLKPLESGAAARALGRASARVAQRQAERQVVAGLRARVEGQSALLDRLAVPIFIADLHARVHGRNQAADALLSAGAPIAVDGDGQLKAIRPAETKALHSALAACCAPTPADVTTVPLSGGSSAPSIRAVVAPLSVEPGPGRTALAAVLVDDPGRSGIGPNAEMLCGLYGLTSAEGQLAARLVAGATLQEACDALGIAITTGRTHLSRVFAKTGTGRQSDLVGLVLTGPALLASGRAGAESEPR